MLFFHSFSLHDVLSQQILHIHYQFGFRKGKGTRDAIGMLRIRSARTLDMGEEICICFVDWQKEFDRVKKFVFAS
jgi:hypothetical protein